MLLGSVKSTSYTRRPAAFHDFFTMVQWFYSIQWGKGKWKMGKMQVGGIRNQVCLDMCPSYWIFLRSQLVTSTTKTHPPTEPVSVGNSIRMGTYPSYLSLISFIRQAYLSLNQPSNQNLAIVGLKTKVVFSPMKTGDTIKPWKLRFKIDIFSPNE